MYIVGLPNSQLPSRVWAEGVSCAATGDADASQAEGQKQQGRGPAERDDDAGAVPGRQGLLPSTGMAACSQELVPSEMLRVSLHSITSLVVIQLKAS